MTSQCNRNPFHHNLIPERYSFLLLVGTGYSEGVQACLRRLATFVFHYEGVSFVNAGVTRGREAVSHAPKCSSLNLISNSTSFYGNFCCYQDGSTCWFLSNLRTYGNNRQIFRYFTKWKNMHIPGTWTWILDKGPRPKPGHWT